MVKHQITSSEKLTVSTFGVLLATTLVSGTILTNTHTNATSSAKASVNVAASCSLSATGDSHAASLSGGVWTPNIGGEEEITVKCNDPGGYAIYAIGYSNDEWKNTGLISSVGEAHNINTADYSEDSTSNSYWSMKLSNGTTNAATIRQDAEYNFNNYSAIPEEYTKVASYVPSTSSSINSSFKVAYGIYISQTQVAGNYEGKVKYTLVDPVNADEPEIPAGKLYMQNATASDCGKTMYDIRDKEGSETAYTTAEINGLCWMTTNLNLAGGTELSSTDTNVPENYSTDTAGFTNGNTLPTSSEDGFESDTVAYIYNSGSTTCGEEQPCYSYYSWLAATAGYDATSNGVSTEYDICPKGWRLPVEGELEWLFDTYVAGEDLEEAPFSAVYAGFYDGSLYGGGTYGSYWSSTAFDDSSACFMDFEYDGSSFSADDKRGGNSVRCVMKN